MNIPDSIIVQELVHEYGYTEKQAKTILLSYKNQNKLSDLIDLIQQKLTIKMTKEELCNV